MGLGIDAVRGIRTHKFPLSLLGERCLSQSAERTGKFRHQMGYDLGSKQNSRRPSSKPGHGYLAPCPAWKLVAVSLKQSIASGTPGPGVLPGAPAGADNRAFAGPLSRRDLMGIARMVPNPAIRACEASRTLAGAVNAVSVAFVDSALRPRPMRCPTTGMGHWNRGDGKRKGRRSS